MEHRSLKETSVPFVKSIVEQSGSDTFFFYPLIYMIF